MVILTMDNMIYLVMSIYILIVKEISGCGDFCVAGGMVTFTASDNGQQITIRTYHLWESNINQNCTADNIDQEMSNVVWYFYIYNSFYNIYQQIKCKNFNIEDNWSLGYSEIQLNATDTVLNGRGFYSSSGEYWKDLTNGGGEYVVNLTANTSIRTDTGSINNSPTPVLVPVVKFRYGCLNTHRIQDIDGDFVKCRLANRQTIYGIKECQAICGSLAVIETNMENCLLSYNGTENGTFAVALQIEDFIDNTTTTPLSSVPMQFIVTVTDDGQPCDALGTPTTATTKQITEKTTTTPSTTYSPTTSTTPTTTTPTTATTTTLAITNTQTTTRTTSTLSTVVTMSLHSYGIEAGDLSLKRTNTACSEEIYITQGIQIYDVIHSKLFVCVNGLVSLDKPFTNPTPTRDISALGSRTILAPYHADMDQKLSGPIYYRTYDRFTEDSNNDEEQIQYINQHIQQFHKMNKVFDANFVLIATWENQSSSFIQKGKATFQLILASDGVDTFVLYIYGHGQMSWGDGLSTTDVWIGYTANGQYTHTDVNSFHRTALQMDKYALTLGIRGLLMYKLTSQATVQINYALQCLSWYNTYVDTTVNVTVASKQLPECPCSLESLTLDPWFSGSNQYYDNNNNTCVYMWPSILYLPYGKQCCYDSATGLWINDRPRAGTFLLYNPLVTAFAEHSFTHDIESKVACCDMSDNCDLYYKRHPIGDCYRKTWFQFGTFWGDPHFRTLDGHNFTFNGLGEYDLLTIDELEHPFVLQARTEKAQSTSGTLSDATIFSAFAAKLGNTSMHVELNAEKNGIILYGNKADLTLNYQKHSDSDPFKYISANNDLIFSRKKDTLAVFFSKIGVSLNVSVGVEMLTVSVLVSTLFRNKTRGLLGNYDEDLYNDFITRAGEVKDVDMTERQTFEYGQTWAIEPDNSVFWYSAEKSHNDYYNDTFIPFFLDETTLPHVLQETAERICNGAINQQCVYDFINTRNEDVANNTLQVNRQDVVNRKENDKTVPTFQTCDEVFAIVGEKVSCEVKLDIDSILEFDFIDNNVGATFDTASNTIQYYQTDQRPQISISATNAQGRTSPSVAIDVLICDSCSGNGVCTGEKAVVDPRNTQHVTYAKCICNRGYEGFNCVHDFDGCATSPCSLGRQCTDTTPEVETQTNLTYICGDCPLGYTVDDNDCRDINECTSNNGGCDHICSNTEGGFVCTCRDGYRLSISIEHSCIDIDECREEIHDCTHICDNNPGGYTCSCHNGYIYNHNSNTCAQDEEGDTCSQKNCSDTEGCIVLEDESESCFCERGYQLHDDGLHCEDVNECDRNICQHNCTNFNGGFTCSCRSGYNLSNHASCTPCAYPNWGDNCENTCSCSSPGTAECHPETGCVCSNGWQGITCDDDINECDDISTCADVKTECINTQGSYQCACREGYEEEKSEHICEDLDECLSPVLNMCDQTCHNTAGSYTCGCESGYTKWNGTHCDDIDECKVGLSGCQHLCENFPGLFNCYCHFGFVLNKDRRTCTKDSNPCKAYNDLTCSHACIVKDGDAHCTCDIGYYLDSDKQTCLDIDECNDSDSNMCSTDELCINQEGTYTCQCPIGSRLENDGRTCTECSPNTYGLNCTNTCLCNLQHVTDIKQSCDSIQGTCTCNSKWSGDTCDDDVNECLDTTICNDHINTACHNTAGGYNCGCLRPFIKDKDGQCIGEETNSTSTDGMRVIEMMSTFDTTLPAGTNLDVTDTYVGISGEIEATLIGFFYKYADTDIHIKDIRIGSIIVVYNIVFDESSQTFQNILPAIGQLIGGTRMIYRNQSVSVTTKAVLGECIEGQRCVEENSTASCRERKTEDNFQLYIILIPSLSFAVLCVVIYIICICVMRQRRRTTKAAQRNRENMTDIRH